MACLTSSLLKTLWQGPVVSPQKSVGCGAQLPMRKSFTKLKMPENNGLKIALISLHGLIRGENLELGRDEDTGGQTRYVLELARALSKHPGIDRVDLITRQVIDQRVSEDYAQ